MLRNTVFAKLVILFAVALPLVAGCADVLGIDILKLDPDASDTGALDDASIPSSGDDASTVTPLPDPVADTGVTDTGLADTGASDAGATDN